MESVDIVAFLQYGAGKNVYLDTLNYPNGLPKSVSFNQAKPPQAPSAWPQKQQAVGLPVTFAEKSLDLLRAHTPLLLEFSSTYLTFTLLACLPC